MGTDIKHFDEIEKIDDNPNIKTKNNQPANQILIKKRINGVYFIASAMVDSKNKALHITSVYTGQGRLMIGPNADLISHPSDYVRNALPPADNITISQKRDDVKEENSAGNLREDVELDAHLQARREAMPKMGLEAARANVQAALHREDCESRKAWGKRKAKAIGAYVSRKMADARRSLIDAVRDIAGDVKLSDDVDIATLLIDQIKRKPKEYFYAFTSTFVSCLLLFNCLYRWHFFSNATRSKVYRLGKLKSNPGGIFWCVSSTSIFIFCVWMDFYSRCYHIKPYKFMVFSAVIRIGERGSQGEITVGSRQKKMQSRVLL